MAIVTKGSEVPGSGATRSAETAERDRCTSIVERVIDNSNLNPLFEFAKNDELDTILWCYSGHAIYESMTIQSGLYRFPDLRNVGVTPRRHSSSITRSDRMIHEEELAVKIARCSNVEIASADPRHPCSDVVGTQCPSTDRQLPEPWFGNIRGARLVFISSNPSIDDAPGDSGEDYPVASWSDDRVARWFVERISPGQVRPAVTFQTPGEKDFFVLCKDGSYRGFQRNRSQPQLTWANTHRVAQEILGEDAHPGVNYAITEVVHCKSKNAVGVKKAAMTCSGRWLDAIMGLASSCKVVVLCGAKVRDDWAKHFFDDIPADFGRRADTEDGAVVAGRDMFVSGQLGGTRRLFVYLPHATSMEPGGRRLPGLRFGPSVSHLIREIALQRIELPESNEALQQLIAAA